MKQYLVLAFSAPGEQPENHEAGGSMEDWGAWMKEQGENVIDMGSPLANGVEGSISGGFNEIKPDQWPAQGYMMIQAEDMAAAQELMKDSPLGPDMPMRLFEKVAMPEMG